MGVATRAGGGRQAVSRSCWSDAVGCGAAASRAWGPRASARSCSVPALQHRRAPTRGPHSQLGADARHLESAGKRTPTAPRASTAQPPRDTHNLVSMRKPVSRLEWPLATDSGWCPFSWRLVLAPLPLGFHRSCVTSTHRSALVQRSGGCARRQQGAGWGARSTRLRAWLWAGRRTPRAGHLAGRLAGGRAGGRAGR